MPECTCHGANPECCYCGGWGWIGDRVCPKEQALHVGMTVKPRPVRVLPRRRRGGGPHFTPGQKVQCPICGKWKVNLVDHSKAIHPGAA